MNWEEFVEKAKEFGGKVTEEGFVQVPLAFHLKGTTEQYMTFIKEGKIGVSVGFGSGIIALDRTCDQMFEVLLGLKENKEKQNDNRKIC